MAKKNIPYACIDEETNIHEMRKPYVTVLAFFV